MTNNATLQCGILCGTAAVAAALALPCAAANVTVTPGFDFTNVVFSVSGASGAQVSFVDSANSPVASGAPLAPASAYAYDVRLDGESVASGAFAAGSEEAPATGEWTVALTAIGGRILPADDATFAASPSNRVTRTDVDIVVVGLYEEESLPSLEDNIPVAAIVAVRGAAGQPEWRAWNGGWIGLDGPAPRAGQQYAARVVVDFRHGAPRVCYLLSQDGGETYVVLKHDGDAWIESSSSSADRVSSVRVSGVDVMSDVTHRAIDGTATVRYTGEGGEETTGSLADALAATPSDGSGAAITLLTNVTWPEGGPQSGDYLIDKSGYVLAGVPDGVGVVVELSEESLEFVCNPNMARWSGTSSDDKSSRSFSSTSLYLYNGLLYTSGGDASSNTGPCPIWAVDPVSGAFVDEFDAASERLDWFAEDSAGRLYTPYIDICERYPEHAGFARRGLDGKWQPMAVWPDTRGQMVDEQANDRIQGYAVHTFDLVAWKGRIFTAGMGLAWGWEGSDSIMSNASVCVTNIDMRFKTFMPFENDLFCLCSNPYKENRYFLDIYRFDGSTGQFVLVGGTTNDWNEITPRDTKYAGDIGLIAPFAGRIVYASGGSKFLYSGTVENHRIKGEMVSNVSWKGEGLNDEGGFVNGISVHDGVVNVWTRNLSPSGRPIRYTVWESSDGLHFHRRFMFKSTRKIKGSSYHDGCYYLSLGDSNFIDNPITADGGDIFRLRDPALADLPAVEAEGAVVVQEGGRGVARFRLSKRPSAAVTAPVRAALGVPALRPDVAEVVFTPENWNEWHEVAFAADDDRIDIVKPGAIVCGGADSGCTWGAARVEVENNDFRVAETPPEGLVDLTRPDGDFTVTTHLRTERDWPGLVTQMKNPFNDDTTLTNTQQRLWVKSRPACDVDYDFGEPTVVNAYGIYLTAIAYANVRSSSYAPPRMWTFSGSNDGVHWRVLDRRSCETGWKDREYRYYSFRNRRAYRKYRITFDHDGYTCAAYTQLSHLEYYNVPQPDYTPGMIIRLD